MSSGSCRSAGRKCEVKMENALLDYYSNVTPKPVDWLWYPYIPLGKLTVIQGDPGDGKSTFVLNLVSLLTSGQAMPDGFRPNCPQKAIYQCAEDGVADTIKPRLEQAGADCGKVAYIVDDDIALTLEDGRIEKAIQESGASVFIVDPIQAFIPPESDMQSATKMRAVLRKLANTAEKYKCAVILIGHMNKGSGTKSLYRGLGSIDIAAIARSVLMISRDESNPNIRYMYPIKSSLAPEGPAIAFSFRTNGGLEWQGRYEINMAELLDSVTVKTTKRAKARAKMIQYMQFGDKPAKQVYAVMSKMGIGSRTVEKVKKEMQIRTYRSGGCWYWGLPKEEQFIKRD
jgi:DNA repair protein RadA/Sms